MRGFSEHSSKGKVGKVGKSEKVGKSREKSGKVGKSRKSRKIGKSRKKTMPKMMVEFNAAENAHTFDFGRARIGFWGGAGVRGLPDSTDFRQTFHNPTRSAPRRGAADENWSKIRSGADPGRLFL